MKRGLVHAVLLFGVVCIPLLASSSRAKSEKDDEETPSIALTSDNVRKATEVVRLANARMKAEPGLAKKMQARAQGADDPVTKQVLAVAGMSARDFTLTTGSLVKGLMAGMLIKAGNKSKLDAVDLANAAWIEKHPAESKRFGDQFKENQRLMGEVKKPGSPSGGKRGAAEPADTGGDDKADDQGADEGEQKGHN